MVCFEKAIISSALVLIALIDMNPLPELPPVPIALNSHDHHMIEKITLSNNSSSDIG
jgi:hypothetical protein